MRGGATTALDGRFPLHKQAQREVESTVKWFTYHLSPASYGQANPGLLPNDLTPT